MGNCKNCKWYNYPKPIKNIKDVVPAGKVFGVCIAIGSNTSDAHQFVPAKDAVCVVGENFGCIHFEEKATTVAQGEA